MTVALDEGVVAAARRVGPVVAAHAAQAEEDRRLPRAVWDALAGAGLLRMYVPRSLGGLEVDPVTATRVVEEVSLHDSAAGWALMVANSVAWWCRHLPDDGVEEVYAAGPDDFVATAFHPPVTAVEVDGGYRLTGRAPLASGSHDAPWLMLTAMVTDGGEPRTVDGAPVVVAAIFRADEAEVHDTWHSLGMRGTDSNDVSVEGVFVPARRTFPFDPEAAPGRHFGGPLYRTPAFGPCVAAWSAVALAVARSAIAELVVLAQGKTPFSSSSTLRDRAVVQGKVGRAEALVRSARAFLYETLSDAWERTLDGRPATLAERADLQLAAACAVANSVQAVELVYGAAGTSGVYAGRPIERHFRDAEVLKQHGFLSESRFETAGQVYLGLPPDLGLVVF